MQIKLIEKEIFTGLEHLDQSIKDLIEEGVYSLFSTATDLLVVRTNEGDYYSLPYNMPPILLEEEPKDLENFIRFS